MHRPGAPKYAPLAMAMANVAGKPSHLQSSGLGVVCCVGTLCEFDKVDLDHVPTVGQLERH